MLTDDQQAWALLGLTVLAVVYGILNGAEGCIKAGVALAAVCWIWGKLP